MVDKHSNLILQLCFDGTISPFYGNTILNHLSGTEITADPEKKGLQETHVYHMVADIPDYLQVFPKKDHGPIKTKKINQYCGYLINLNEYTDIEDLISKRLKKNSRKNLRWKHRKLESNHKITYGFHYGDLDKKHYDYLFDMCYDLMEVRFHQKKIYNRFLIDWKFYHTLFYPKILTKEASLFVIYDNSKPITLTLNFHKGDIVFSFIQIYDVEYARYSLGDIAMYKNLDWCYHNGFSIWDVSKGETDNKLRWCNHTYDFKHHIFYNSKSIASKVKVYLIAAKLVFKQTLRDKGIIGKVFQLDKLYYYTRMGKLKNFDWKNP